MKNVNLNLIETLDFKILKVRISPVFEAEIDEMWSFVGKKKNRRWLWHAVDHDTGKVLAFVFGSHTDETFEKLMKLLKPFGIKYFFTDHWYSYQNHLPSSRLTQGKQNTQKIERKHLTLRTRIKRLARRTICFSKSERMHDLVVGLLINRLDFQYV